MVFTQQFFIKKMTTVTVKMPVTCNMRKTLYRTLFLCIVKYRWDMFSRNRQWKCGFLKSFNDNYRRIKIYKRIKFVPLRNRRLGIRTPYGAPENPCKSLTISRVLFFKKFLENEASIGMFSKPCRSKYLRKKQIKSCNKKSPKVERKR